MTAPTAAEVERARNIATRAVRAGRNLPPSTFGCCSTPQKEREWRAPEVEPIQRITDEIAAEFAAAREDRDAAQARAGALAEALRLAVRSVKYHAAVDLDMPTVIEARGYISTIDAALAQTDAEALAALRASVWREAAGVAIEYVEAFLSFCREQIAKGTKESDIIGAQVSVWREMEVAGESAVAALRERGKA